MSFQPGDGVTLEKIEQHLSGIADSLEKIAASLQKSSVKTLPRKIYRIQHWDSASEAKTIYEIVEAEINEKTGEYNGGKTVDRFDSMVGAQKAVRALQDAALRDLVEVTR